MNNSTVDTCLSEGAYNAVNICLQLQAHERITLITDRKTLEIASALVHEVNKIGSEYTVFILEEYIERPIKNMPQIILDNLAESQVSIFACVAQAGELHSRRQMIKIVNENKIRHAHMVNINQQIMCEGMRANFLEVDAISQKLMEKARIAKFIRATTRAGTHIVAEFSPNLKWIKTSGIISKDKWGNLPGGEIFTAPYTVNGHFVVDGVVGDYLCQKYGNVHNTPLHIDIVDNRISKVECAHLELLTDFIAYTHTDENSDRVGEFAIGTNIAVKNIIGNILQDEKIPGIHIAFGNPYPEHTGQIWTSTTHIDCVGRNFDIWMDDEKIMEEGQFLI